MLNLVFGAFALFALFVVFIFILELIKLLLKKEGIPKIELKSPLSLFRSDKAWKTFVKVLSFVFGLICIYGLYWGFSTTPEALFERPNYTTYYDCFAAFGSSKDYKQAVLQIKHDNGSYYFERLYFSDGYIKQQDTSVAKVAEQATFNDTVCNSSNDSVWNIKLDKVATQKEISSLKEQELTKEQWVKLVNNGSDICYLCKKIIANEDGSYFDLNDDGSNDIFICNNCLEKYKDTGSTLLIEWKGNNYNYKWNADYKGFQNNNISPQLSDVFKQAMKKATEEDEITHDKEVQDYAASKGENK